MSFPSGDKTGENNGDVNAPSGGKGPASSDVTGGNGNNGRRNKMVLKVIVGAIAAVILVFSLLNSPLLRKELGTANPVVTATLTPEQKAFIAQGNSAGERVLYQCTSTLPSGSAECDLGVQQIVVVCTSDEKAYFDYCKDARLDNYLQNVGGYAGLIERIDARAEMIHQSVQRVYEQTVGSSVQQCMPTLPSGNPDCDNEMKGLETKCITDNNTYDFCADVHQYYKLRYDEKAHNQAIQEKQHAEQEAYQAIQDKERLSSPVTVDALQDCLGSLPNGTVACDQSASFVRDDCAQRQDEIPKIDYLAQKCSIANEYYEKVDNSPRMVELRRQNELESRDKIVQDCLTGLATGDKAYVESCNSSITAFSTQYCSTPESTTANSILCQDVEKYLNASTMYQSQQDVIHTAKTIFLSRLGSLGLDVPGEDAVRVEKIERIGDAEYHIDLSVTATTQTSNPQEQLHSGHIEMQHDTSPQTITVLNIDGKDMLYSCGTEHNQKCF